MVTLGMTMLAGAIVASANVNKRAEQSVSAIKSDAPPTVLSPTPPYNVVIQSGGNGTTPTPMVTIPVTVIVRGDSPGAVYSYEMITPTPTPE